MISPEFGGQAPLKVIKGAAIVIGVLLVLAVLLGFGLAFWPF